MGQLPFRVTTPLRLVLDALLADGCGDHYGLAIATQTGLKPGTLYPILARLEACGWLTSFWEQVDEHEAGRPRRRYYRLTGVGINGARGVLENTAPALARGLGLGWRP
jgi:PadR family transcriptional regulator